MRKEFERFDKYLPSMKLAVFTGSDRLAQNAALIKQDVPQIVICTPARLQSLVDGGDLNVNDVKLVVIDDCDKVIVDSGENE
ncbi:hypothetical protein PENTCL1PPCAC_10307, partial [Pristionchus entomophagus]